LQDAAHLNSHTPLLTQIRTGASFWSRLLRWGLAAALALLTLRLIAADPAPLLALAHVQPSVLVGMALLIVLNQWLMASRFKLVMKECAGVQMSRFGWFRLTSVGQFLNLFVPQLGHLHRGLILKREFGASYAAYGSGLFVFFWFELVTSILLATIVVAFFDAGLRVADVLVLPVLVGAAVLVMLVPLVVGALLGRAGVSTGRLRRWVDGAQTGISSIKRALIQPSFLIQFLLLNIVVAAGHVAMLRLAFTAVGAQLTIETLMLFQVLLKLSNQIVLTPGNLGITELAYGVLAGASSGGVQQGIGAALLVRTMGTAVMLGLGWALGALPVLLGGSSALGTEGPEDAEREPP
jgi:uncharacterized membrane protein YbhN (UPF0104 family)